MAIFDSNTERQTKDADITLIDTSLKTVQSKIDNLLENIFCVLSESIKKIIRLIYVILQSAEDSLFTLLELYNFLLKTTTNTAGYLSIRVYV